MKTKPIRPLTKLMLSKLMESRELESSTGRPVLPKFFGASFSGLYKRKLVDVKNEVVDGKEILVVTITSNGRQLLDKHFSKD